MRSSHEKVQCDNVDALNTRGVWGEESLFTRMLRRVPLLGL